MIKGTVIEGRKVARGLGYPTANISVDAALAAILTADDGVYAARVTTADGATYNAMGYLKESVLELHLFDFKGDLYGKTVSADLVKFIRPELKFASPEALRQQIEKDKTEIKNVLKPEPSV